MSAEQNSRKLSKKKAAVKTADADVRIRQIIQKIRTATVRAVQILPIPATAGAPKATADVIQIPEAAQNLQIITTAVFTGNKIYNDNNKTRRSTAPAHLFLPCIL